MKNADDDDDSETYNNFGDSDDDLSSRIMKMALPKQEFIKDDLGEESVGVYEYKPKYWWE